MIKYCPTCETDCSFKHEERELTFKVREEQILLNTPIWICEVCDEIIIDENCQDPVEKAFNVYRNKHGLLFPVDIHRIRNRWGLSQVAFAKLLGMSQATINRYEQGALQQEKEDVLIRACDNSIHMQELINHRGHLLTERQKTIVSEAIVSCRCANNGTYFGLSETMLNEKSIRSGFQTFDYNKYAAVVVWLCQNVDLVTATKLYKLLFYVDFLYFRIFTCSLTGAMYSKMPYGPVPYGYHILRTELEADDFISVNERTFQNKNTGEVFIPGPNSDKVEYKLSDDELKVLEFVCAEIGSLTPNDIKNKSHHEFAYKDTEYKAIISYEKALVLSISCPKQ